MPDPHGPNRLEDYVNVHQRYMADWLLDGFVLRDGCNFTDLGDHVVLKGKIHCQGNTGVDVKKRLRVLGGRGWSRIVQTEWFKYNTWLKGYHNIFRYDSKCGHRALPHKHVFDVFGDGSETEFVEYTRSEDVPSLSYVIGELSLWYELNSDRL